MDKSIVNVNISFKQENDYSRIRESIKSFGLSLVYCPMCEVLHENNTLCQMSWSD